MVFCNAGRPNLFFLGNRNQYLVTLIFRVRLLEKPKVFAGKVDAITDISKRP